VAVEPLEPAVAVGGFAVAALLAGTSAEARASETTMTTISAIAVASSGLRIGVVRKTGAMPYKVSPLARGCKRRAQRGGLRRRALVQPV
jgi:hypothetical protein